jgi:hypothetical protein
MNAEIYQVSLAQFMKMIGDHDDREVIHAAARFCSEILVGMFGGSPLCYIGLAPRTLISSEAYAWMLVTSEGEKHPFLLARYARGVLETVLLKYPIIYGHCFNAKSARWLRSLGAEFTSEIEFEFRRD